MGTPLQPTRAYGRWLAAVAVLGSAGLLLCLLVLPTTHWFDLHDIRLYHDQSRWAVGGGTLFVDIRSEYPLTPHLIFGGCRLASQALSPVLPESVAYAWLWLSAAWFLFLAVGHLIATRISRESLWIWLAPGAIFFALFRFDIYPAATTLLALFALRDGKLLRGAFWLGMTVALKGYALFLLPAFLVFVLETAGPMTAVRAALVAGAPFALANLAVLGFAGWEGMLSPYRFHARRVNLGESTYDAVYYLFAFLFEEHPTVGGPLPFVLQAGCALFAAAMRPRTFAELIDCFLVGLLGFMSFSVFYSPQFILWMLPLACFASGNTIRWFAIAYGWVTFLYYPVCPNPGAKGMTLAMAAEQFGWLRTVMSRTCIVLLAAGRFALIALAVGEWRAGRRKRPVEESEMRVELRRFQEMVGDNRTGSESLDRDATVLGRR